MRKALLHVAVCGVLASSSSVAAAPAAADFALQELEASDGQKSFLCVDVNADGHIDLIVAEQARNRIAVFVNDGSGVLNRNGDYSAGQHPGSLAALDFDDDGNVDVAIANHEADSITLLRGRDGAKFDAVEQSSVPIATQPHSHVIRTADLDGDGILDLVVDSRDRFGIYVLRGDASGGFEAPGQGVDVGGSPYLGFVVSDLNGDGKPDIATPNQADVSVMLNRSTEEIAFERIASISFPSPFAVAAADLNGDASIDLVVAGGEQAHGVATFSGDGDGHFEEATFTPMARGAKLLATGNVTGDEFSDAVITSWNSEIVLLIGGATGASPVRLAPSGIRNPWGLAIADFNKDGRGEVVVGDASSSRVHIYSLLPSQD